MGTSSEQNDRLDKLVFIESSSSEVNFARWEPPLNNSDVWKTEIRWNGKWEIYFHNRAKRTILEHAYNDYENEVGGVLIGNYYRYKDNDGRPHRCIEIVAAIPGSSTIGTATRLVFTPDTWSFINQQRELQFPDHRIVGWYHTHPNHGIFLSSLDKEIQNSFFSHAQLALVIDHVRGQAGFFIGHENTSKASIESSPLFEWDVELYHPNNRFNNVDDPVTIQTHRYQQKPSIPKTHFANETHDSKEVIKITEADFRMTSENPIRYRPLWSYLLNRPILIIIITIFLAIILYISLLYRERLGILQALLLIWLMSMLLSADIYLLLRETVFNNNLPD